MLIAERQQPLCSEETVDCVACRAFESGGSILVSEDRDSFVWILNEGTAAEIVITGVRTSDTLHDADDFCADLRGAMDPGDE